MNHLAPYSHYQQPIALGGLFGWLRRTVNKVVKIITPFIPKSIAAILDDFTNGDGSFTWGGIWHRKNVAVDPRMTLEELELQYPISIHDETKLDKWYNKFISTLTSHFKKINSVNNTASLNKAYEEVYRFIAILEFYSSYVLNVGQDGLSNNALLLRNAFLELQIASLEDSLNEKTALYIGNSTEVFVSRTIQGNEWNTILGFNLPNQFSITSSKLVPKSIIGPPKPIVIEEPEPLPVDPTIVTVDPIRPDIPDELNKKPNYTKLAVAALAIIAIFRLTKK